MKKLLFFAAFAVLGMTTMFAQTEKGAWLIEINTGFGEVSTSTTGLALRSVDGNTSWAFGGEVGYFIMDDLALKAGVGYGDPGVDGIDGTFNWKFGGKYYIAKKFPVGVDINGSSSDGFSPMFVGIQGGYAWFVAENVSIEPGIRYGFGVGDDADLLTGDNGVFSFNVGFNIFFN